MRELNVNASIEFKCRFYARKSTHFFDSSLILKEGYFAYSDLWESSSGRYYSRYSSFS